MDGDRDVLFADNITSMHPEITHIFEYWKSKITSDFVPSRSDIDPLEFWGYLPRIWILEVHEGDPYAFYIRLFGSDIVEKAGIDKTGKYMTDFETGFEKTAAFKNMVAVTNLKKAVWYKGLPSNRHTRYVGNVEYIMCPLSNDGEHVNMIFCYSVIEFSERHKLV